MKRFQLWSVYQNSGEHKGIMSSEKAIDYFTDLSRSEWHYWETGSKYPDFHAYPVYGHCELRQLEVETATDFQNIEAKYWLEPISPIFSRG